ncbi:MAG: hypothetical protein HUU15_09655 [Candidatus Brocadiae bacterium]|nr:hypothetical protein [Candidatus Brocadiia bacterium]
MYYEIYGKGVVSTTGSPEYSQPFDMQGANAFQLAIQLINLATGATSLSVDTQGSNDLQGWSTFGTTITVNAVGQNFPAARTAVAFRWVRLKVSCAGAGGVAVFFVDCNTASL